MSHDKVVASTGGLTRKLIAKDRTGNRHVLSTVGEAAQFINANFSAPRSGDVDWKLAATSLEKAVYTDDFVLYAHATKAVAELLRTEHLLDET
jgi:hypothetical protein